MGSIIINITRSSTNKIRINCSWGISKCLWAFKSRSSQNLCLYKTHMFQCMGKIFSVEFPRVLSKFHWKIFFPYLGRFHTKVNLKNSYTEEFKRMSELQQRPLWPDNFITSVNNIAAILMSKEISIYDTAQNHNNLCWKQKVISI